MTPNQILEDLGNNLILRRSTPEDAEALGKYNGTMHVDPGEDYAGHIELWIKELLNGSHPTFNTDDFTIIEDTSTGEIVSSLCLIDQTWAYEGIPFPVGRPELVSTHPDYRRRGLVRKQFEVVHQWSAERGQKLQFITGIPWYYRQFGYEMTLNLGGSRIIYLPAIPKLKDDQEEPFTFREAVETDIPFITSLHNHGVKRGMISGVRDEAIWQYNLFGRTPKSTMEIKMQIILDGSGEPVGFFSHSPTLHGVRLSIPSYELVEGVSWLEATPSVMRKAQEIGEQFAVEKSTEEKKATLNEITFNFGADHPSYHTHPRSMPRVLDPYAYYIRVPDLPDFIRTIAPALDERLAQSYAVGYSGELKLNFYTDGLNLTFENGKIKAVESWEKPDRDKASAHFPDLTFLQLLFGYRSYDEIREAYADCYSNNNEAEVLLRILFPKKPSRVYDIA